MLSLPAGLTRSGWATMLEADLTSSAMGAQGLRCGMRSLKATSSSFVWTSRTSLLNAGMDRRSAESALHGIPTAFKRSCEGHRASSKGVSAAAPSSGSLRQCAQDKCNCREC